LWTPPLPRFQHSPSVDSRSQNPALCGPQTKCLVSFELRSSKVKDTFLREAARSFSRVERLSKADLPRGFQADHIELYCLRL
jgi:hypothetical protein